MSVLGATAQGTARGAHTANMTSMSKTRAVFQLSGWLKALASCAEGRKQRHTVQGGLVMRPGGRWRRWPTAVCTQRVCVCSGERARLQREQGAGSSAPKTFLSCS